MPSGTPRMCSTAVSHQQRQRRQSSLLSPSVISKQQRRQSSLLPAKDGEKAAQRDGPYPKGLAIVLDTAHDGRERASRENGMKGKWHTVLGTMCWGWRFLIPTMCH